MTHFVSACTRRNEEPKTSSRTRRMHASSVRKDPRVERTIVHEIIERGAYADSRTLNTIKPAEIKQLYNRTRTQLWIALLYVNRPNWNTHGGARGAVWFCWLSERFSAVYEFGGRLMVVLWSSFCCSQPSLKMPRSALCTDKYLLGANENRELKC